MNIPDKILFFVYGTLKKGYYNHRLLQGPGVTFKGEFTTEPNYTMYSLGGYPAVMSNGTTAITGELYEVTNKNVIENIYRLEGYSGNPNSKYNHYSVEHLTTPYGKATLFVYSKEPVIKKIVPTGKW